MYPTPSETLVILIEWMGHHEPGEIMLALREVGCGPAAGDGEGGWIVLGTKGIEFLENGPGIYVDEFWEELQTGFD